MLVFTLDSSGETSYLSSPDELNLPSFHNKLSSYKFNALFLYREQLIIVTIPDHTCEMLL